MFKHFIVIFLFIFNSSLFADCSAWGPMALDPTKSPNPYSRCNGEVYKWNTPYDAAGGTNYFCQSPASNKHEKLIYTRIRGGPFVGALGNYYTMNDCFESHYYVNVASCSAGFAPNAENVCTVVVLSNFDNDSYQCRKNGGHPDWSISNPSGKSVFNSAFRLQVNHKCLNNAQSVDAALNLVLSAGGGLSNLGGRPDILGVWLSRGLEKFKGVWSDMINGLKPEKDLMIGLPRIGNNGAIDVAIIEHDIPKGSDGVTPSREPEFDIDGYNAFLREEFFPKNPNISASATDPHISQANLDSFTKTNQIFKDNNIDPVTYTFKPDNANIWKSTSGSPKTDELLDYPYMVADPAVAPKTNFTQTTTIPTFRVAPVDSTFYPPVPVKVADVPVTSTVTYPVVNSRSVKQWQNTRTYPDNSTSLETTQIDETYKTGSHTMTTVSPDGASSTTSETFSIPNYVLGSVDPKAYDVVKTSPISKTPLTPTNVSNPYPSSPVDPITGYPTPSTSTPVSNITPSTATGQDLINAPMPAYSFPALTEFVPFDSNPVTDMISGANLMFTNITAQLAFTKTVFDNTKTMLEGGWTPPVIPAGSCGEALAFNFHGKHIDLCPPLVNSTAVASPIISSVVTIGGMVFAVTIMIGGF